MSASTLSESSLSESSRQKRLLVFVTVMTMIASIAALWPLLEPVLSPFYVYVAWVGRTDIETQFMVTDAETGSPITNAKILIRAERSRSCKACEPPEFTLETDAEGRAKHLSQDCLCYGSHGRFRKPTFGARVPLWKFQATAEGYSAGHEVNLEEERLPNQVQSGKPFATLQISIVLIKSDQ